MPFRQVKRTGSHLMHALIALIAWHLQSFQIQLYNPPSGNLPVRSSALITLCEGLL